MCLTLDSNLNFNKHIDNSVKRPMALLGLSEEIPITVSVICENRCIQHLCQTSFRLCAFV